MSEISRVGLELLLFHYSLFTKKFPYKAIYQAGFEPAFFVMLKILYECVLELICLVGV